MFFAVIPFSWSWSNGEKFFHASFAVVVCSQKEAEEQVKQFEAEFDGAVIFECK